MIMESALNVVFKIVQGVLIAQLAANVKTDITTIQHQKNVFNA